MIISFVTFVVLTILGISLFYSTQIQDSIKFNQLERFARKIISASESTFYAGQPSKTTITAYFPRGVTSIEIIENSLVFSVESASGTSVIAYGSNVPIEGTLSFSSGLKKIQIIAQTDKIEISET